MAILCFCPPESRAPPSPTIVSYFSGSRRMKLAAFAALTAIWMSRSVTPSRPIRMLSAMLRLNRTGSRDTMPILNDAKQRFEWKEQGDQEGLGPGLG